MTVTLEKDEILQAVKLFVESRVKLGTNEDLKVVLSEDGDYAEVSVAQKIHTQQE